MVIGAVGLTLLALLTVAAFNADSLPLIGGGETYSAAFSEAGGLKPGDEVRIAGVKVGKVEDVDLDGDHVRVTFKIKGDPGFGTETGASIRVKTILGAKYLALHPKGPGQLKPGSEIPLKRTVPAYDVVQAFSDLTTTTEKVDTDQLAKALDTISTTFQDSPAEVRASIKGLSKISRTVASRDKALGELLDLAERCHGRTGRALRGLHRAGQGRRPAVQGDQQAPRGDPQAAEDLRRARHRALRPGRGQRQGDRARPQGPEHRGADARTEPIQPRPERQAARALRPGLQQRPRQRPLVRQLRPEPGRRSSGAAHGRRPVKNLKRRVAVVTALALVAALTYVLWPRSESVHVTAYFPRTVGIYPGSHVRVLGVRIGEVEKITPEGDRVRVELKYDEGRKVPADAKAAALRLRPSATVTYNCCRCTERVLVLRNGAVIPETRTAVPVELDRVFDSLHTTADALGPQGANNARGCSG